MKKIRLFAVILSMALMLGIVLAGCEDNKDESCPRSDNCSGDTYWCGQSGCEAKTKGKPCTCG